MAHYRGTVPSERTPDDTFAYMADFTNVSRWDPTIGRSTQLDPGPTAVGARYLVVMKTPGSSGEIPYTVTEFDEEARRMVVVGKTDSIISTDTITVADDASVTYDAQLTLRGARRLIDPIANLLFQLAGRRAASGLRRQLMAS